MASNTTLCVKNLNTNSFSTTSYTLTIVNVTDATYNVLKSNSGCLHVLDRAGGITLTLPPAKQGLHYTFLVKTTFTGTFQIDTASDADTLEGLITIGESLQATATNAGQTTGIDGPASADHQYVADADTKGRHLGTRLVYKCLSDSKWQISGNAVSNGNTVTPFT